MYMYGDEAHQADTDAIGSIISKIPHINFRFGLTGTLDESKTHEMQCRAWFGSIVKTSTTKELIDRKILSQLKILSINFLYSENERNQCYYFDYDKEIDFIINHERRNQWIIETAMRQNNNTMILFNFIEKHGIGLYNSARKIASEFEKQVYLITRNC